jgi:hypothetical protein
MKINNQINIILENKLIKNKHENNKKLIFKYKNNKIRKIKINLLKNSKSNHLKT